MKAFTHHALSALLRHSLWLIPFTVGALLWGWTYIHPLKDTYGREFLSGMFFVISLVLCAFVFVEHRRESAHSRPVISAGVKATRAPNVTVRSNRNPSEIRTISIPTAGHQEA